MFAAGPGRGYRLLAHMLAQGVKSGELQACDADLAAGDLTGLWHGVAVLEVNLKARAPMSLAEIKQRAQRGVDLFFTLYAAPAGCR